MSQQDTHDTTGTPVPIRERFAAGKRFRVVKEGSRLHGYQSCGRSAFSGWSHDLSVGDVIESTGYGPGFGSDPGYGIHWTNPQSDSAGVGQVEFYPSSGHAFGYHPTDGYLEEVTDDQP